MKFEDKFNVTEDTFNEIVTTLSMMYEDNVRYWKSPRMISSGKKEPVIQNCEFTVQIHRKILIEVKIHRSTDKIQVWLHNFSFKVLRSSNPTIIKDIRKLPELIYDFLKQAAEMEA